MSCERALNLTNNSKITIFVTAALILEVMIMDAHKSVIFVLD